jgi:D-alanyl-D-alanine dipeptidase
LFRSWHSGRNRTVGPAIRWFCTNHFAIAHNASSVRALAVSMRCFHKRGRNLNQYDEYKPIQVQPPLSRE